MQEAIRIETPSIELPTKESVIEYYKSIDRGPRQDVIAMINLYPRWEKRVLTTREFDKLDWYFANDSTHISWMLTEGGTKRSVAAVAERFLDGNLHGRENSDGLWDRVGDIWEMVSLLKRGGILPPIIVVSGKRYHHSPESSFIDGVHRALAYAVHNLKSGSTSDKIYPTAYVGEQGGIFEKIRKRIGAVRLPS